MRTRQFNWKRILLISATLVFLIALVCFVLGNIALAKTLVFIDVLLLAVVLLGYINQSISNTGSQAVRLNVNHRHSLALMSKYFKNANSIQKKAIEKQIGRLIAQIQFQDAQKSDVEEKDVLCFTLFCAIHSLTPFDSTTVIFDRSMEDALTSIDDNRIVVHVDKLLIELNSEKPIDEESRITQLLSKHFKKNVKKLHL